MARTEEKEESLLPEQSTSTGNEYKSYPKRFLILSLYCFTITCSSTLRLSFSSITDCAESFWKVDESDIDWLVTVCYFLYPFGSALGELIQSKYGFCMMVWVGQGLTLLGTILRWMSCFFSQSDWGYALLMIGQVSGGIGLPPVLNGAGTLSNNWFNLKERDNALAASIIAYYLGFCLAYMTSVYIVSEDDNGAVTGMHSFMFAEALLNLVATILIVVFLQEFPPSPPSFAAANKKEILKKMKEKQTGVKQSKVKQVIQMTKDLIENKQYNIFVAGFSVLAATYQSIYGIIDEYVAVTGYTDGESAIYAVAFIGAGMIGIVLLNLVITGRAQHFPKFLKFFTLGVCGSGIAFVIASTPDDFGTLVVTSSCIGLFAMPLVPVALALSVEVTYPMEESQAIGFAKSVSYLATVVGLEVLHDLLQLQSDYYSYPGIFSYANIALMTSFVVAGILLLTFNPELKRYNADVARQESNTNNESKC